MIIDDTLAKSISNQGSASNYAVIFLPAGYG